MPESLVMRFRSEQSLLLCLVPYVRIILLVVQPSYGLVLFLFPCNPMHVFACFPFRLDMHLFALVVHNLPSTVV